MKFQTETKFYRLLKKAKTLFVPPQGGEGGSRSETGEDAIPDTQTGCRGASPYRFAGSRTVWREIAQIRRGHSPPRFASQMARHPRCFSVRVILSAVEVCEVQRSKRANRKAKPLRDLSKSVAIPCAQSNICAGTWRIHTAPRTKQNEKSPPFGELFCCAKATKKIFFAFCIRVSNSRKIYSKNCLYSVSRFNASNASCSVPKNE